MPRFLIAAGRRGLAAVVLFLAGVAAVDATTFKVWHPALLPDFGGKTAKPEVVQHLQAQFNCSVSHHYCAPVSPGWAIPVAIAVGLIGVVVAVLIYRPRPHGLAAERTVCVGS
jgi:hypothetical protein